MNESSKFVLGEIVGELESGAYLVDQKFAEASLHSEIPHPVNLALVIGWEIAEKVNENRGNAEPVNVYVYDPVCGCGIPDKVYTITGIPEVEKPFLTRILNRRAVSIEQASRDGVDFQKAVYIVAHLGGGMEAYLGLCERLRHKCKGSFQREIENILILKDLDKKAGTLL